MLQRMERESVIGITDNDLCVYDNVLAVNVFFAGVFTKISAGYFKSFFVALGKYLNC